MGIQPRLAHSGPCILELHQVTSAMKYKNHMGFESDVPAGNDTRCASCDGCLALNKKHPEDDPVHILYHSSFIIIYHHLSSFIIIYHHLSSFIIIYHQYVDSSMSVFSVFVHLIQFPFAA